MHADTLFHRMLDQEKQIEEAKAEGRPFPTFPPLMSQSRSTRTMPGGEKLDLSQLPQKTREAYQKRLEGLSDAEREVEERAIKAEVDASGEVATNLGGIYRRQDREREQRVSSGKETMGDRIMSMLRWR